MYDQATISQVAQGHFKFLDSEVNICTQIKFDFPTRTWMDKTASLTKDFENKWNAKKGFQIFNPVRILPRHLWQDFGVHNLKSIKVWAFLG